MTKHNSDLTKDTVAINIHVIKYYAYVYKLTLTSIAHAIGEHKSYIDSVIKTGTIDRQKLSLLCNYLQCSENDLLYSEHDSVVDIIKSKSDAEIKNDLNKKVYNKSYIERSDNTKIAMLEQQIRELKTRNDYLEDIIKNIEQIACQIL